MESRTPIFREIHKNTWLRRLTNDGKKLSVGHHKKNDRYWVVFCVHDDCEALLEGYVEPRFAPSHSPDWTISLQNTMHISHTLVGNEQDFEFVITSPVEVFRFTAQSWECMKEWVETLRSKLREMKIISPRENVYSKLPETRLPLLPTRDPTSPLPPPPSAIPALVPGVEVLQPSSPSSITTSAAILLSPISTNTSSTSLMNQPSTSTGITQSSIITSTPRSTIKTDLNSSDIHSDSSDSSENHPFVLNPPPLSNTTSRSIMNLLSNPIQAYSVHNSQSNKSISKLSETNTNGVITNQPSTSHSVPLNSSKLLTDLTEMSLAKIFSNNVLSSDLNLSYKKNENANITKNNRIEFNLSFESSFIESPANLSEPPQDLKENENNLNVEEKNGVKSFTPQILKIPRPQTSKSNEKKSIQKNALLDPVPPETEDSIGSTNITIIQLSNTETVEENKNNHNENELNNNNNSHVREENNDSFNVQIIPSNNISSDKSSLVEVDQNSKPSNSIIKLVASEGQTTTVQLHSPSSNQNVYGKLKINPDKEIKKIVIVPNKSVYTNSPLHSPSFQAVTNISVGYSSNILNTGQDYEAVFFSAPVTLSPIPSANSTIQTKLNKNDSDSKNNESSHGILRHHSLGNSDIKSNSTTLETNNESRRLHNDLFAIPSTSSVAVVNSSTPIPQNQKEQKTKVRNEVQNRMVLTRGLTEMNINRPSRIDKKHENVKQKTAEEKVSSANEMRAAIEKLRRESNEHRRRSSSASESRTGRENQHMSPSSQNVRQIENPHPVTRLTLREQQVLHLRTEMMHPGGVRLQLRRKECIGSIAWIDAFGAVWIAGWKQKEHPILYNALHIGDQLISVGSITITSAAEANKIIRSTQSLYIEIIVRRVPFGRVYAIRRDMEGQCLGFIRDGNTATIVDVVPNSLAARHGVTPKAKSCDGLSLAFWVLTEINGRPLNLFFKDNEVSDRLNSVGRDISILVQPSDLVVKLKKQLKSMRNHKDFIVQ